MSDSRDERFEAYLREFRPAAALPLPTERKSASRRYLVSALAAVAAMIVAFAIGVWHTSTAQLSSEEASLSQLTNPQLLTLGSANRMLAQGQSVQVVLDSIPFHSQKVPIRQGQRSALEELGKEMNKL